MHTSLASDLGITMTFTDSSTSPTSLIVYNTWTGCQRAPDAIVGQFTSLPATLYSTRSSTREIKRRFYGHATRRWNLSNGFPPSPTSTGSFPPNSKAPGRTLYHHFVKNLRCHGQQLPTSDATTQLSVLWSFRPPALESQISLCYG